MFTNCTSPLIKQSTYRDVIALYKKFLKNDKNLFLSLLLVGDTDNHIYFGHKYEYLHATFLLKVVEGRHWSCSKDMVSVNYI